MDQVSKIIGNTPLVKLDGISEELGVLVYAKYEATNPGASIKDRAVKMMLDQAEARGTIVPGKSVLIEPTSGNTGIALAMLAAVRGYRAIICMPDSMSIERRALMQAYGAELVLTPGSEGLAGSVARAEELENQIEDAWIVGQFVNPDNPLAHQLQTAPEISEALGGAPDYIVAGAGTGGTITGLAHYFKEQAAHTRFIAVQPSDSPIIGQAMRGQEITPGPHGIQGIGPNFIPPVLDLSVLDDCVSVTSEEALSEARQIAKSEGLLVGISSGANVAAVRKLVEAHPEAKGSTIVTFLVDTGERYISTKLFEK